MSPDEQEAKSRRYSNDRIILLPLTSGAVAVFNNGGDLCGYMPVPPSCKTGPNEDSAICSIWRAIFSVWHRPAKAREAKPRPTLEELGL